MNPKCSGSQVVIFRLSTTFRRLSETNRAYQINLLLMLGSKQLARIMQELKNKTRWIRWTSLWITTSLEATTQLWIISTNTTKTKKLSQLRFHSNDHFLHMPVGKLVTECWYKSPPTSVSDHLLSLYKSLITRRSRRTALLKNFSRTVRHSNACKLVLLGLCCSTRTSQFQLRMSFQLLTVQT